MESQEAAGHLNTFVTVHNQYEVVRNHVISIGGSVAKSMRAAAGLSVRKYAAAIGITPSYLSKVEMGKEVITPGIAERMLAYQNAKSNTQ